MNSTKGNLDLSRANLSGVNLEGADLSGTNLSGSYLEGANLSGANLEWANLRGANLEGANLSGTNIEWVNLRGANLRGAKGIMQWQAPQGVKRACYSVKHANCVMHKIGCLWGSTEDVVSAIRMKYGDNSLYEGFLLMQVKALEVEL